MSVRPPFASQQDQTAIGSLDVDFSEPCLQEFFGEIVTLANTFAKKTPLYSAEQLLNLAGLDFEARGVRKFTPRKGNWFHLALREEMAKAAADPTLYGDDGRPKDDGTGKHRMDGKFSRLVGDRMRTNPELKEYHVAKFNELKKQEEMEVIRNPVADFKAVTTTLERLNVYCGTAGIGLIAVAVASPLTYGKEDSFHVVSYDAQGRARDFYKWMRYKNTDVDGFRLHMLGQSYMECGNCGEVCFGRCEKQGVAKPRDAMRKQVTQLLLQNLNAAVMKYAPLGRKIPFKNVPRLEGKLFEMLTLRGVQFASPAPPGFPGLGGINWPEKVANFIVTETTESLPVIRNALKEKTIQYACLK